MLEKIYFTSDTHFFHKNICFGISTWQDKEEHCRPFNTIEEMNDTLVENINSVVKENDILYHLGDFSYGSEKNAIDIRHRIKCQNIHLILGNHDGTLRKAKNKVYPLFESVSDIKEVKLPELNEFNIPKLVLCHYPIESWNGMGRGSLMLHGHCYGKKESRGRQMDVGIDCHSEFKPFKMLDIIEKLKNIEIVKIDHH